MELTIPEVPIELHAVNTIDKDKNKIYETALHIYQSCLNEIKNCVFPCKIKLHDYNKDNVYIKEICANLKKAGYHAERVETTVEKYHHDGDYFETSVCIVIDNKMKK